jgi:hypothetical protein
VNECKPPDARQQGTSGFGGGGGGEVTPGGMGQGAGVGAGAASDMGGIGALTTDDCWVTIFGFAPNEVTTVGPDRNSTEVIQ